MQLDVSLECGRLDRCMMYCMCAKLSLASSRLLVMTQIGIVNRKPPIKTDSPIACRAHAVSLPCRAAKGLERVFPHLIYTVRPCLIHTCHATPMPCSDHAILLKATAQHACGLPARVCLLPATTQSSTKIVIRSVPILLTTIHTCDCKEW
jgi:hypothetical protein